MSIPTAHQFLINQGCSKDDTGIYISYNDVEEIDLIEFTKLHVIEALIQASENATTYTKGVSDGWECWEVECVNKDSIMYAYPLDNIK